MTHAYNPPYFGRLRSGGSGSRPALAKEKKKKSLRDAISTGKKAGHRCTPVIASTVGSVRW
jgi:hypothetical protein